MIRTSEGNTTHCPCEKCLILSAKIAAGRGYWMGVEVGEGGSKGGEGTEACKAHLMQETASTFVNDFYVNF